MKKILSFSFVTFIIDIISKIVVSNYLNLNESIVIIKNFFNLTYVRNYGAAWSILNNRVSFLVIISLIIIGTIIYYISKKNNYNKMEILSYCLILGGALGNLINRVINGYVIDFLDFNILGYDYPIFNLADTFIVIGVVLLFVNSLKKEKD
mgnify:CR=1 FL=1